MKPRFVLSNPKKTVVYSPNLILLRVYGCVIINVLQSATYQNNFF